MTKIGIKTQKHIRKGKSKTKRKREKRDDRIHEAAVIKVTNGELKQHTIINRIERAKIRKIDKNTLKKRMRNRVYYTEGRSC